MYGKYGDGGFAADGSAEERIPAICVWSRLRTRLPHYAFSPCGENR